MAKLKLDLHDIYNRGDQIEAEALARREAAERGVSYRKMTDDDLPFVAELLQVKIGEATWTGALERVLQLGAHHRRDPANPQHLPVGGGGVDDDAGVRADARCRIPRGGRPVT